MFEIFLFWFLFSIAVAVLANTRGRNGFGWFLFSILLSPLLGIIFVLALPRMQTAHEQRQHAVELENSKQCPFCAELIKRRAQVCKHCGRGQPETAPEPEPEPEPERAPIAAYLKSHDRRRALIVFAIMIAGLGALWWANRPAPVPLTTDGKVVETTAQAPPTPAAPTLPTAIPSPSATPSAEAVPLPRSRPLELR